MRLVIRSGVVTTVTRLRDTVLMSPPISDLYLPVDTLFAIIQRGTPTSVAVTYDSQYGYPSRLVMNPQMLPIDAGIIYENSNLRVP